MASLDARISIAAKSEDGIGILVSLHTDGDYADEMIDRRFYSIAGAPPDGLPPLQFWGAILQTVSRYLLTDSPRNDDDGS